MKNWRATLLLVAACAAALLSSLTTVLVLGSAFLPVEKWLTVVATAWQLPALRRRLVHTRRRLWRRVDAALRGDATASVWRGVQDDVAAEFGFGDSDSDDDDDDCLGYLHDWKHGRLCLISR